jgi:arginyl-tRNA synthetase
VFSLAFFVSLRSSRSSENGSRSAEAARVVLRNGLAVLGVSAPERI